MWHSCVSLYRRRLYIYFLCKCRFLIGQKGVGRAGPLIATATVSVSTEHSKQTDVSHTLSLSGFQTTINTVSFSRSLVSGLALPPSLWLLRDVGGWNRPTSRALSVFCARDVTGRDLLLGSVPAMRSSTWQHTLGTSSFNTISTAAGTQQRERPATDTLSSRRRCTCHAANGYEITRCQQPTERVTHAVYLGYYKM